mmetsp:Transcript_31990/g.41013  ORF Transcript_31990/g.41013 Transcript_31990/m.41013 type:complete len:174 (-) Transcript_31990:36-557(-)
MMIPSRNIKCNGFLRREKVMYANKDVASCLRLNGNYCKDCSKYAIRVMLVWEKYGCLAVLPDDKGSATCNECNALIPDEGSFVVVERFYDEDDNDEQRVYYCFEHSGVDDNELLDERAKKYLYDLNDYVVENYGELKVKGKRRKGTNFISLADEDKSDDPDHFESPLKQQACK